MGDSWISPIDFVLTWPSMLSALGLVDMNDLLEVSEAADATEDALQKQRFGEATKAWGLTERTIELTTAKYALHSGRCVHCVNSAGLVLIAQQATGAGAATLCNCQHSAALSSA